MFLTIFLIKLSYSLNYIQSPSVLEYEPEFIGNVLKNPLADETESDDMSYTFDSMPASNNETIQGDDWNVTFSYTYYYSVRSSPTLSTILSDGVSGPIKNKQTITN